MMDKRILIIAGIPASGKTEYGKHISTKMNLPFLCKDFIKEELFNVIHYDTSSREMPELYGTVSNAILFHVSECLMKVGVSFVLEGNFTSSSAKVLNSFLEKYTYKALTILFDGDVQILHKRFWDRNDTDERHPGLKYTVKNNLLKSYEVFEKMVLPNREFGVGDKEIVDTSDFSIVNYDNIDIFVSKFLDGKK